MLVLSLLAATLPFLELTVPALAHWAKKTTWLVPTDPGMAQLLLGAIAGSCITVVSVVYSVLLIALTFASIQFSPRILTSFLKDRVSQGTLGVFIGTFSYCLILLPSIHGQPYVFVPTLSMTVGLALATVCIFYLIYFIQHIALAIQANYIVHRIARETENVLRSQFGAPLKGACPRPEEPLVEPPGAVGVPSSKSGYIQFIDELTLMTLATKSDTIIYFFRNVGQFIPAGVPCFSISPQQAVTSELAKQCLACFHIGPLRAIECDVEFGMLQMVDIALKAISPAVNDPSTAIACIDQLSASLLLSSTVEPPSTRALDNAGNVRLIRRQTTFPRLLDIAYNQISPYGKGDMAVSLRIMRALQDISGVTDCAPYLAAIRKHAQGVVKACAACFPEEDCQELFDRLAIIDKRSENCS
jgi:uncharacterized membrane protein